MAFMVVLLFLALWLGLFVGMFVLMGFGLYRMAQHAGAPCPWMAFIPVANAYLTGLLAERAYYTYNGRIRKLAWWCVITQLFPVVFFGFYAVSLFRFSASGTADEATFAGLMFRFLLYFVSLLLPMIFYGYCLYYLFRDYSPDNAVLFTLVGVLFNISFVFLLIERNTVPVSVTGFGFYPYGRPKYDQWHRWNQVPPQQAGPGNWPPPGGPNTTGPGDYYRG